MERVRMILLLHVFQQQIVDGASGFTIFGVILLLLVTVVLYLLLKNKIEIEKDHIGIVYIKRQINPFTKSQPVGQISNNGSAGYVPTILPPDVFYKYHPFYYEILQVPMIDISHDSIGLVETPYGENVPSNQGLGKVVQCNNFQDAEAFFSTGGQRGPQMQILDEGKYQINTKIFNINIIPRIHISSDQIGIVKSNFGEALKPGQGLGKAIDCDHFQDAQAFLSNGGQRGPQVEVLTHGKYSINTELFNIDVVPVTKVARGEIALVKAKYGDSRPTNQNLGKAILCNKFQDADAFLKNGGQQGPQIEILTEGDYQINTELFEIINSGNAEEHGLSPILLRTTRISKGMIGIVTTKEGKELPENRLAGTIIPDHKNFTDGQQFINNGGYMGLQEPILMTGNYQLNPWFVDVEIVPLTKIESGTVGVVISSMGEGLQKTDQLVEMNHKGIWSSPLYPGDHAINTELNKVLIVPTQQITLNWASGTDKLPGDYDAELRPIKQPTSDGFNLNIEVTQVIKIHGQNAPKMVSLVGLASNSAVDTVNAKGIIKYSSIKSLVTKVIGPTVENYFHESAQHYSVEDFHKKRDERKDEALEYIREAIGEYGVQAVETLLKEIGRPDELEEQWRKKTLYEAEMKTEATRQKLVKMKADFDVTLAGIDSEIQRIQSSTAAEAEGELIRVKFGNIDKYLEGERIKQLPKVKMPEVMVGGEKGGSSIGEALFAQMLKPKNDNAMPKQLSIVELLQVLRIQHTELIQLLAGNPNPEEAALVLKKLGFVLSDSYEEDDTLIIDSE